MRKMAEHQFKVGDKVIFTNIFGVCWGVKTITALDERNGPTYFYEPSDTPWFSVSERNLKPADEQDIRMMKNGLEAAWSYFQDKYGFPMKETFGCW